MDFLLNGAFLFGWKKVVVFLLIMLFKGIKSFNFVDLLL